MPKDDIQITAARCRLADATDHIDHAEQRILSLIDHAPNDACVAVLANVLHDISLIRVQIMEPRPNDQRSSSRVRERAVGLMRVGNNSVAEVAIRDISIGGAHIECEQPVKAGDHVALCIAGFDGSLPAEIISRNGNAVHLTFDSLTPEQTLAFVKRLEQRVMRY